MKKRAAIIGAGVAGLTTAVVLGEHGYEPIVFAENMPLDTTSAVAAAIWFPYDAFPEHRVIPWAFFTYGRLVNIANDKRSGVSLVDFRVLSRSNKIEVPPWAEAVGTMT